MMEMGKIFTKKRMLFIAIFMILVLLGKNINFSPLVGSDNQFFTLFQFFGPIAGGFLGAIFGAIAVLFAELIDFFIIGKEASLLNILRLAPMIFAAYYFGTKKKNWGVAIPLIAIFAFIFHPIGREVWFFTLFWTIPIIGKLLPNRLSDNILIKSFGATFTAHAIGGALWIWTVPMTAAQWTALIPIVIVERFLFGAGIALSYVAFNIVISWAVYKFKIQIPSNILNLDKKYRLNS
jgi:hypothetical protein